MPKENGPTFDFRYIAVVPVFLGFAALVSPAILVRVLPYELIVRFGLVGFLGLFGVTFLLMRFNRLLLVPLARVFFSDSLRDGKDFVVLEIEDAATYDQPKIVSEEVGILYRKSGQLVLETLDDLIVPGDTIAQGQLTSARPGSKMSGLKVLLPGRQKPSILKPVYPGFSSQMQNNPDRACRWMLEKLSKL